MYNKNNTNNLACGSLQVSCDDEMDYRQVSVETYGQLSISRQGKKGKGHSSVRDHNAVDNVSIVKPLTREERKKIAQQNEVVVRKTYSDLELAQLLVEADGLKCAMSDDELCTYQQQMDQCY